MKMGLAREEGQMPWSSRSEVQETRGEPLRACVRAAMRDYFHNLGDHSVENLYQMVLQEVEQPLLETVLQQTGGNQTRAARVLGISRSTLRKKLTQYGLS